MSKRFGIAMRNFIHCMAIMMVFGPWLVSIFANMINLTLYGTDFIPDEYSPLDVLFGFQLEFVISLIGFLMLFLHQRWDRSASTAKKK